MNESQESMPQWYEFIDGVLRVLDDGQIWPTADLKPAALRAFGLSEQLSAQRLDTGGNRAEGRVGFALSHLTRAGAVRKLRIGHSQITDDGRRLLAEHPQGVTKADVEALPAFSEYTPVDRRRRDASDSDDLPSFWFVGAYFYGADVEDQTEVFVEGGIWRNGYEDKYLDIVKAMLPGEKIAIKAAYTRKYGAPFETHGNRVSVMAIKATGTIIDNDGDGRTVTVEWDPQPAEPREWYFYTNQQTVWRIREDRWTSEELIDFTFNGAQQDYDEFRNADYWADRFGDDVAESASEASAPRDGDAADDLDEETPDTETYTVSDIVADGCFVEADVLDSYLKTLQRKKNLILQGPPGTGKTWLAKRLGRALIGTSKPGALLTSVQFHPSTTYEEFVRGWRPSGDGRLHLEDGMFLGVVAAAQADPGHNHVLVIEEINRANLAQVFGELLTLIEADKRKPVEALTLANARQGEAPLFLPENLYLIGTMNLADRSLAMVDFALRRRFAFADLHPTLSESWKAWVHDRNEIGEEVLLGIAARVEAVNRLIREDRALGEQYCIGHSFFTPPHSDPVSDPKQWLDQVIEQEIRPLLAEYWFDSPSQVAQALSTLRG